MRVRVCGGVGVSVLSPCFVIVVLNVLSSVAIILLGKRVCFVCLFDLNLNVPLTIFPLNRDGSSWVEAVLR